ncbi:MAG: DNA-formamidopyrimidine glycosylase [Patescibacteria group bacterium]
MPELPEVHTTMEGLRKTVVGKTIIGAWSDFHIKTAHGHRNNLKNKKYFANFKKKVIGAKIKSVERKGKNILINLGPSINSGQANTIVIHMKMTGHLMYGATDPFVHLIFKLKNPSTNSGQVFKDLVLSDMRKFANVCLVETEKLEGHESLKDLGKDALQITKKELEEKIKGKKNWPIKSALMDQESIAGIGNIYSDEILFETGVHPLSLANKLNDKKILEIYVAMRKILKLSIKHGGDSKSDYRNVHGEKGNFQNLHKVYGKKGLKCPKTACSGIIERIVVKGRSAHFCPKHQKLYK